MPSHDASRRALNAAELDAQVVERVRNGMTFREIAAELDYSVGYIHKIFTRALRKITQPSVEEYRADQLARIELERQALLDILAAHHVVVSNGHIVSHITGHFPAETELGQPHPNAGQPIYGDPLTDDGPVMAAIDRLIKLDDQEMKVLGGYPAQKFEMSGSARIEIVGIDPKDVT